MRATLSIKLVENHFVNNKISSFEEVSKFYLQKLGRREIDLMLCEPP